MRPHRRARPSAPAGADLAQPAVRERSNADPFPSTEAIEQRREWPNTRIGLGVDVDPDGRPSHENLLKPRDTDTATTKREAAPAVKRERVTSVGRLHLADPELSDRTCPVCDPVEPLVMESDQHAVAGEVGIGLDVRVPERDGDLKRLKGVLGRLAGPASVGDRDRAGLSEERVHTPQCLGFRTMDVMSLADRAWPVLRLAMGAHVRIYRVSNGLIGQRFPGAPPMLLLDHVGAKTGTKRTTPLVYVEDDRDVVIVASKGGHPRNPAWYHNLRANPDTTVQIGAERRAVHARVATPEERERLWPKAVATYAGYRGYQQRTDRTIPLVILEPRRSPTSPASIAGAVGSGP